MKHSPAWMPGASFSDHSYRGFAADGPNGELLLLNIDSKSGEQLVSYCDSKGKWHARGKITFPIRSCYPQVALRSRAAHVMAIGDIVEPVKEWRELKFEKLNRAWDYVFRRLFYSWTPNITNTDFAVPIEIDSVEKTGGHISNFDLYIDPAGAAHLLYLKRPHQYAFIRDKYFPGRPVVPVINGLRRVSKPGQRMYADRHNLPWVRSGLGIAIISTSKGLMTDQQARRGGIGGEVLCYIW